MGGGATNEKEHRLHRLLGRPDPVRRRHRHHQRSVRYGKTADTAREKRTKDRASRPVFLRPAALSVAYIRLRDAKLYLILTRLPRLRQVKKRAPNGARPVFLPPPSGGHFVFFS